MLSGYDAANMIVFIGHPPRNDIECTLFAIAKDLGIELYSGGRPDEVDSLGYSFAGYANSGEWLLFPSTWMRVT
jgi:hypothetical protein